LCCELKFQLCLNVIHIRPLIVSGLCQAVTMQARALNDFDLRVAE
jgi:hypothetical protein